MPLGTSNPDWAILKHDGRALCLVRETTGTRDFPKLRTTEADKVRRGQKGARRSAAATGPRSLHVF